MLLTQTESRDPAIDRLSDPVPSASKRTVVASCFAGKRHSARFEDLQLPQFPLDFFRGSLIPYTLEDLAKDDVGQRESSPVKFGIQPIRFRVANALQVVDPHGRIDDDHAPLPRESPETGGLKVAAPRNLASQSTDAGLAPGLNQQTQGFLHHGSFCPAAAAAHRLTHQSIVDVDVRSHAHTHV